MPAALLSLLCYGQSGISFATETTQNARVDVLLASGRNRVRVGHYEQALSLFKSAYRAADLTHDTYKQAISLISIASCEIYLFDYRDAVKSLDAARQLAGNIKSDDLLGAAAVNQSTIYSQLGDTDLAEKAALEAIPKLEKSPRADMLVKSLLILANLRSEKGQTDEPLYRKGIEVAQNNRDKYPHLEAPVWDGLGTSWLLAGKIDAAEFPLQKAREIELQDHDLDNLATTEEHLAELQLKKGKLLDAKQHIDAAFSSRSAAFRINPQYYPLHIRAKILLGLGQRRESLAELHRAVESANEWRQGALPGDATDTRTVAQLHDVYQDYAELAAQTGIENNDGVVKRQAFEVLAENRAASLREQLALALSRDFRLPPEYYELHSKLLAQIQSAQARVTLGNVREDELNLQRTRIDLSELENKIGLYSLGPKQNPEKIIGRNSLRDVQSKLTQREALLSFCLAKNASYLWAVTKETMELYRLPGEEKIKSEIAPLSQLGQGRWSEAASQTLSRSLLGSLGPGIWKKPDWLITTDGALLSDVPFSSLPSLEAGTHCPIVSSHTLRFLPSEYLMLVPAPRMPEPRFVGVADPIYNFADSRRVPNSALLKGKRAHSSITLARLVGSEREIRNSAKAAGMPEIELLSGDRARGPILREALTKTPAVLHFAIHVVSPEGQPQEAGLALSLTPDGMPELLTPEAIDSLRVPGTLVVLSGCSSGQGKAVPGAGLMGLSRAFLIAGASAVVVSAWPTPDDSGNFFTVFYNHLRALTSGSLAKRAAVALQQAQLEMQRHGGYQASPSFWAAYSIISKE